MWLVLSMRSSSCGRQWTRTAIWLDIVPVGTKRAASLPSVSATRRSSSFTVGSSPNTSSPTAAAIMAANMPGVGFVSVSLRRSIIRINHRGTETQRNQKSEIRNQKSEIRNQKSEIRNLVLLRFWRRSFGLPVLQIPAAIEFLEEQFAVAEVGKPDLGGFAFIVECSRTAEAAQFLQHGRILGELGLDVADQLPEGGGARVAEHASVELIRLRRHP